MTQSAIKLLMFDLDGTLVDSIPDLAWSADRTLERLSLPLCGIEKTRNYIGNGLHTLIKRILTQDMDSEPDPQLYDKAVPIFWEYYGNNVCQFSTLYGGAGETLEALKLQHYKLACVTNKAEAFTKILLQHLQIIDLFDQIVGGDTLTHKKPDPMPLLHVANTQGIAIEQCLMVGDSRHDIAAAKAAGMRVVGVPYGYNHGEDIALSEPDYIVQSLTELPDLLLSIR